MGTPSWPQTTLRMIVLKQIWSHQVPAWKNFIFSPNVKQVNSQVWYAELWQSGPYLPFNFWLPLLLHVYSLLLPPWSAIHTSHSVPSSLWASVQLLPSARYGIISLPFAWKTPYSLRSNSDVSMAEKPFLSLLNSWPELDRSLPASIVFHLFIQQNIGGIYSCQTWFSELGKQRLTRERRILI